MSITGDGATNHHANLNHPHPRSHHHHHPHHSHHHSSSGGGHHGSHNHHDVGGAMVSNNLNRSCSQKSTMSLGPDDSIGLNVTVKTEVKSSNSLKDSNKLRASSVNFSSASNKSNNVMGKIKDRTGVPVWKQWVSESMQERICSCNNADQLINNKNYNTVHRRYLAFDRSGIDVVD